MDRTKLVIAPEPAAAETTCGRLKRSGLGLAHLASNIGGRCGGSLTQSEISSSAALDMFAMCRTAQ